MAATDNELLGKMVSLVGNHSNGSDVINMSMRLHLSMDQIRGLSCWSRPRAALEFTENFYSFNYL